MRVVDNFYFLTNSQIKELLDWEEQTQQKFSNNNSTSTNKDDTTSVIPTNNENNPLRKFTQYCEHSKNLLHIFRIDIYRPLCDFFSDEDDENSEIIREVPKLLEKIVQKWEALLHFSPLNEKLFNNNTSGTSSLSRDKLINTSLRVIHHHHSRPDTDLVLRLIPDLYQKKLEVLRLATKWRLISKAKVIQRRGTYTLSPTTLKQRRGGSGETTMPRCRVTGVSQELLNRDYDTIQEELRKTRSRYDETSQELRVAQEKCQRYEGEMEFCRTECASLRDQLQQTAELRKAIEMRVCDSYSSSGTTAITTIVEENNNDMYNTTTENTMTQLRDFAQWEKELERIKAKYSRQKVKFLNARKQIEALNKQLEISHGRCSHLHTKIEHDANSCRTLEKQLETARKNIQTQGSMVDALQHQCYTLKQELDTSNVKKGELYTKLNNTLEHCKTVEHDLKQTRLKFKDLADENGRRRSREDELERENQQLRKFIESNGLLRRRSSMETNIIPLNENNSTGNSHHWKFQSQIIKEITPSSNRVQHTTNKQNDCFLPDIKAARSF